MNATLPHAQPAPKSPSHDCEVVRYLTLSELRHSLLAIDDPRNTTAIVVLDEQFKGHLPTLIQRSSAAFRLVLVALSGAASVPAESLMLHCRRLGWEQIACEQEASPALYEALARRRQAENIVVFWPTWHAWNPHTQPRI